MSSPEPHDRAADAAARWLARRDRGLSPAEQDEYLQWLRSDPAHGAAVARLERAWRRLDAARHWQPRHSVRPNADLLAGRRPRRGWWMAAGLAAAAAVAVALYVSQPGPPALPANAVARTGPEQVILEDGSTVELNAGAEIGIGYTATVRRIRLLRGEAHFTVAKNPARPFLVSVGGFTVRAVGTAFAINYTPEAVAVLVTEGRVQLTEAGAPEAGRALAQLGAGQQAVMRAAAAAPELRDLTRAEMQQTLAWQARRLEFTEVPLREVVAEFNRVNAVQLVVADGPTGDIVVGGSFRADSVESFVRLLDAGFDVAAEREDGRIVLRLRR